MTLKSQSKDKKYINLENNEKKTHRHTKNPFIICISLATRLWTKKKGNFNSYWYITTQTNQKFFFWVNNQNILLLLFSIEWELEWTIFSAYNFYRERERDDLTVDMHIDRLYHAWLVNT